MSRLGTTVVSIPSSGSIWQVLLLIGHLDKSPRRTNLQKMTKKTNNLTDKQIYKWCSEIKHKFKTKNIDFTADLCWKSCFFSGNIPQSMWVELRHHHHCMVESVQWIISMLIKYQRCACAGGTGLGCTFPRLAHDWVFVRVGGIDTIEAELL